MNTETSSVEQQGARRIVALMPELTRRYAALRAVLEAALAQDGEADDSALWLAHSDLEGVVKLMQRRFVGDKPHAKAQGGAA